MPWGSAVILGNYIKTCYQARRFRDRQALEAWQARQVLRHVEKVRNLSPFYRQHWQAHSWQDWGRLPTVDKTLMMDHFDAWNTVGITKAHAFSVAFQAEASRDFSPMIGNVTVGLSSGTSGHRGLFLVSRQERLQWAGTILAKVLPAPLWVPQKVAFFLRANSQLYTSVGSQHIQFQFFDLLDDVSHHIDRLNRYQPTVLVAPPSMLCMLANAIQSRALTCRPNRVISVAEVLDPFDRTLLESVFPRPIHQVYQCTEGFLAATCAYGTLHLNEDVVAIQKVWLAPSLGLFSPIITDFTRLTQPIIRYHLNDVLKARQTPCPCGSSFLALDAIEGRYDDVLYFAGPAGLVPVFPDFIRQAVLSPETLPWLKEYQVEQTAPGILQLRVDPYRPEPQFTQVFTQAFAQLANQVQGIPPVIQLAPMVDLPANVKRRRIQRHFTVNNIEPTAL